MSVNQNPASLWLYELQELQPLDAVSLAAVKGFIARKVGLSADRQGEVLDRSLKRSRLVVSAAAAWRRLASALIR